MISWRTRHGIHNGGDNDIMEDKAWDTQLWRVQGMRHTMVKTMISWRTRHGTYNGGDSDIMEDKAWDTMVETVLLWRTRYGTHNGRDIIMCSMT